MTREVSGVQDDKGRVTAAALMHQSRHFDIKIYFLVCFFFGEGEPSQVIALRPTLEITDATRTLGEADVTSISASDEAPSKENL